MAQSHFITHLKTIQECRLECLCRGRGLMQPNNRETRVGGEVLLWGHAAADRKSVFPSQIWSNTCHSAVGRISFWLGNELHYYFTLKLNTEQLTLRLCSLSKKKKIMEKRIFRISVNIIPIQNTIVSIILPFLHVWVNNLPWHMLKNILHSPSNRWKRLFNIVNNPAQEKLPYCNRINCQKKWMGLKKLVQNPPMKPKHIPMEVLEVLSLQCVKFGNFFHNMTKKKLNSTTTTKV